jgi:hypothetical protein
MLPLKFFSLIHVNAALERAGEGHAGRLPFAQDADCRAHQSHEGGPLPNDCRF